MGPTLHWPELQEPAHPATGENHGARAGLPLAPDQQAESRQEKGKGRVGAWQHFGVKPGRKILEELQGRKVEGL